MFEVEGWKILGMKENGMNGASNSRSTGRSKIVVDNSFLKINLNIVNARAQGDQVHFQSGKNREFFDGRATKK